MKTPDEAIAYLERQRSSGSTAWDGLCEKLARTAYGLPAHYSSAELHASAIPSSFRHGHDTPCRGDIVMYRNGRHGHIATATGRGWQVLTNDYTGRGRVGYADARDLVSWCGASSWFVADAWWSSSSFIRTHTTAPHPPTTPPTTPNPETESDPLVFIISRKIGQPGDGMVLCSGGRMVGLVKTSWDASPAIRSLPTLTVTDPAQWSRLVSAYGPPA